MVPEYFGEIQLVNGKIFPFLEVQPRKYRLRILNAARQRVSRCHPPPWPLTVHQLGVVHDVRPQCSRNPGDQSARSPAPSCR